MSFEFPPHGHNFQYITVYEGKDDWRLCRWPPCGTCLELPRASIFHIDCFKFARSRFPTLVSSKKLLELVLSKPPRPFRSFPDLGGHIEVKTDIVDVIERLAKLPPELREMVVDYCPEATWWKYNTILTWYQTKALQA